MLFGLAVAIEAGVSREPLRLWVTGDYPIAAGRRIEHILKVGDADYGKGEFVAGAFGRDSFTICCSVTMAHKLQALILADALLNRDVEELGEARTSWIGGNSAYCAHYHRKPGFQY